MKLSAVETAALQGAEEARSRALQRIEHDESGAALVAELRAAADQYAHASWLLQERLRHEARAGRRAS